MMRGAGVLVANGEAEIVVHPIQELVVVPGVDVVGPLPGELQDTVAYPEAIMTSAQETAPMALINFLPHARCCGAYQDDGHGAGLIKAKFIDHCLQSRSQNILMTAVGTDAKRRDVCCTAAFGGRSGSESDIVKPTRLIRADVRVARARLIALFSSSGLWHLQPVLMLLLTESGGRHETSRVHRTN